MTGFSAFNFWLQGMPGVKGHAKFVNHLCHSVQCCIGRSRNRSGEQGGLKERDAKCQGVAGACSTPKRSAERQVMHTVRMAEFDTSPRHVSDFLSRSLPAICSPVNLCSLRMFRQQVGKGQGN